MTGDTPRRHPPPDTGMIRIAPLAPLVPLLRERGIDAAALLARHGLNEGAFGDPDRAVPIALGGRLLAECAAMTATPHFGLLVGLEGGPRTPGAIGFLMSSAPDVRSGLQAAVANADIHDRGGSSFLEVSGRQAIVGYEVHHPDLPGADQIHDTGLSVIRNIMRALCGPEWSILEVRLMRSAPADPGPYRRCFRAPLVFAAEQNGVVFDAAWLDRPNATADPYLHRHFSAHVAELRQRASADFVERVHKTLISLLRARRCSVEDLAAELGMHPRTLTRRLEENGAGYRELHAAARHELALHLLGNGRDDLATIAAMLGFSGTSAFSRAFAQREGMPPGLWRRDARNAPPPG